MMKKFSVIAALMALAMIITACGGTASSSGGAVSASGSAAAPAAPSGEPLKMNWNAITGKKGKCHVYVDNYKNKDGEDRQSNKIKKLYAYDENVTTVQPAQTQTPQYSQPAQTGGWKAGAF